MSMSFKATDWINVELKRFKQQLPIEDYGKNNNEFEKSTNLVRASLVKLAKNKFQVVTITLASYITDFNVMSLSSGEQQQLLLESNMIILETIKQCFEMNSEESSLLPDDIVKKHLLSIFCPLINQVGTGAYYSKEMQFLAGKIVYLISKYHFSSVFERISRRIVFLTDNNEDSNGGDDLDLIQYLHVPVEGLIVLFKECCSAFKSLKKNSQQNILRGLHQAIWNWIENYPDQFTFLYKQMNIQLSELSEKLFTLTGQYVETTKKKILAWPLQVMLLLLSPESIQDASGSGDVSKGINLLKRQFLDKLKRCLSSNHKSSEYAVLTCIQMCKAATYINRQDNIACFLVSQVMNELKTTLFNPDKLFVSTTGLNIYQLMVDLFVASFRINHRNNQHFEICFQPDSNPIFQLALAKGIYQIVEETRLTWWPSVEVLYNRSAQIRNMFEQCVRRITSYDVHLPRSGSNRNTLSKVSSLNVTKKKDDSTAPFENDTELLLWLVKLFHIDPQIALSNPDKCAAEIQASSMQIMNGLVIMMMFARTPKLALQVSETLLSLHSPENIELWNPEAPMATFWEISSQIVYNVADRLLTEKVPNQLRAMRWLQKILKCRIQFIDANKTNSLVGSHNSICSEALSKLEMMFLMCLWSTNTEKVLLAMKCFGLLFEEAILLSLDRPSPIHPTPLTTVYYKFSNEVRETGRTALHKRILSVLRDVNVQTEGNLKAWKLTLARWQKLTNALTNYPREELTGFNAGGMPPESPVKQKPLPSIITSTPDEALEGCLSEWCKMTGYLCSFGGICVSKEKDLNFFSQSSKGLEDNQINRFISEMLTLLVCENEHTSLQIRSAVREALGSDLSVSLYPSFFCLCKATMACFFDPNGQVNMNPYNNIYSENLIYIIRTILENKSDSVAGVLPALPVEEIINALLKYIRSLVISVQSLVIKTKMCQLVENIMLRRGDLSFHQEMKFRNRLVEDLTNWVLYASDESQKMSQEIHAISCGLDEAAMRAVAVLLKGLPLQPENIENDITEAKSNLFLKHFTLFMNILNNCYDTPENCQDKRKGILAPHFVNLRTSTVQAMSNMLSANIDSGLMHAISLGYHEDPQTRATFLEVLTDILKQGTEFENLAETVLEDRFERIIQLVTNNGDNDIPIVMALCNSVTIDDMDEVARVLVNLFDMKGLLDVLLINLFKDEVEKTETQQTLFRGNTIASKVMSYSFKIYGSHFLQLLLGPLVTEMVKHNDGKSYEVDSARLENGENIGDNTQSVIELANSFMDKVRELKDQFPVQLRSLCYCLNKAVQTRFPSSAYDAVASAVFLRFINPAIVSPDTHGIINDAIPRPVRRGLMLLSKILQNLANHLYFTKEAHMEIFNGFLENSFYRLHSFFREIAVKPETEEKGEMRVILTLASDSNVLTLHKLLWFAQEKMARYLVMFRGAASRDPYEKLMTLLAHLGPPENQPVKLTQRIIRDRKESVAWCFEDFMARHEGQNKDELEYIQSNQLFYGDGRSKAGRLVFYYIARRYMNDMISDEVFLYHILLTLQPIHGEGWELVVDFSHTSPVNRFKIDTLAKAFTIIPENQLTSLQAIYVYNINHSLKQYMELHERIMRPLKNNQKIIIIDKLAKLYEYIEHVKLPASTLSLENDVKRYSVLKITLKGSVILKVNPSSVQLQSPDKVKVLGFSVYINDVFYASEIEKASSHEEVLSLEFSSRTGVLNFHTAQAAEIASYINHIHSRWKLSQPDKNTKMVTKKIRPKDVPGTLLNMSLVNLGNQDPSLRLAAYNLLCSLTQTFNLQVNERLLEAKGICIPSNCTLFITSISAQLAEREPNLTLEFLDECINCFSKCDDESRNLCLNYMAPWLPNLVNFSNLSKKDPKKEKMVDIISKLIELTISNRKNYPFIQAQIWGNVGKIPDLLDVVIELFVKTSSAGGFLSEKAEVMADTTVTLASANVPLVSKKIFERFHMVIERTTVSPTDSLERHLMWDDIAIMARYLLMLSFNNSLDVSTHLADIFHVVILLVSTGPVTLRASIHGLVINALQSILTCSNMKLSNTTQLLIRTKLEDLSLQKFYLLFGISSVKSVPIKAFLTERKNRNRVFHTKQNQKSNLELPLSALESITEVLLDVLESCINDCNDDTLLKRWQTLCLSHCISHNPAIQPRCVVAMGYILKVVHNEDVSQMLEVLSKACGVYMDYQLIESLVMCLAKYQLALPKESEYHKVLFWVAVGIMQFGEQSLYPSALSLLENNLSVCHGFNMFADKGIEMEMMEYRNDPSYHWIFKQLDHLVGLSFSTDFHFALIALLVKGIRHPSSKTKSTSLRIVNTMLYICSNKELKVAKDKIEVNKDTLPYLAALMPVSEEIRLKLYNEKPTYSATLTMKRRRSKIYTEARKSQPQSPSGRLSSSGTVDVFFTKRKHMFESSTYNSLLDPMLLRSEERQALLIVLLATLVNHTMDDFETKTLFEVLAEASVLYPEVLPICYSIINQKLCSVLSHSNDAVTLTAAQTIVQSISSLSGDRPTLKLSRLTSIGFHGLHSFPGPFTELPDRVVAPQMFARYIDLVVNKKSNLTTEARSSGQIFTPPICTDDVIVNTFSHSLNTIVEQPAHQTTQTPPGAFSPFKRVGSYSPARRHRNSPSKFESVKEKPSSNHLSP